MKLESEVIIVVDKENYATVIEPKESRVMRESFKKNERQDGVIYICAYVT